MRFRIDHDLHIHSRLSSCSSDPEQTAERILLHAKENELSTVCVTDHYWDSAVPGASDWYKPQNFEHISSIKPLPSSLGTRFLFGCETDMRKECVIGLPPERFDDFDFVIIPTTHLHMHGFTIAEADTGSREARGRLWLSRLDALLDMPLPFHKIGIAHLACGLILRNSREEFLRLMKDLPETELERLFAKAAAHGVGIELNMSDMSFADSEADAVLRPFRIAKWQGCKFYLGSDSHHPRSFAGFRDVFARAITLLELNESDKFII